MWVVVNFVHEESFEVVPHKWMAKDFCWWPLGVNGSKLKKMVEQCVCPRTDESVTWRKYEARVLGKKYYAQLVVAKETCTAAQLRSGHQCDDASPGTSSKTSDEESGSEAAMDQLSPIPRHPAKETSPEQSTPVRRSQVTSPSKQQSMPEAMNGLDQSAMIDYCSREFSTLKSIALKQSIQISKILSELENLKESHVISENLKAENGDDNGTDDMLMSLPLNTSQDVEELETLLESDENVAKLTKYLANIGGTSVMETTTRILRILFTNQAASEYSWQGMKNKKVFSTLKLKDVMFSAVRRNKLLTNGATDKEMETVIRNWCRNAKSRMISKENYRASSGK